MMMSADAPQSLADLALRSAARDPNKVALLVPHKGEFRPITYAQFVERMRRMAAVMKELGLGKGDRLALFSENCVEWALADWAAQSLGVVVVPIYPTLPADQAQYILNDSGAKVVLTGSAALHDKVEGKAWATAVRLRETPESFAVRAETADLDDAAWRSGIAEIRREDLATIIYTSGTTGNPKGVMLPHRGFVSLVESIRATIPVGPDDVFLSFLPLSHVYERMAGHVLPIGLGATIGYSTSLATLMNDLQAVRPTLLLCVPRFMENARDRILDNVAKQSPLKQKLFHLFVSQGTARFYGKPAPLFKVLDRLVGQKVRERFGGRIRYFVSGGMALPQHVANFFLAFGLVPLQGYGLTETYGPCSVNHPDHNRPETVGQAIGSVEIRLAEDGEILVKGDGVMDGYYGLPEETAQAIDAEGWFHTGDIGRWDNGSLMITDRKKDILVLGNGKNVAPQPIENKLRSQPHIGEAVLFGDSMDYVCALIVPDFERLKTYAQQHGLGTAEPADLVGLEAVRSLIKSEVQAVNQGLADFEKVKRFELIDHTFTVDSGELTPSLKVKRKVVSEKFADVIARMQR